MPTKLHPRIKIIKENRKNQNHNTAMSECKNTGQATRREKTATGHPERKPEDSEVFLTSQFLADQLSQVRTYSFTQHILMPK